MSTWFQRVQHLATRLIDPDREERVAHFAKALERELAAQKRNFSLSLAVTKLGIEESDLDDIADRVFKVFLSRAWSDNQVNDAEERTLAWISEKLAMPPARAARLKYEAARAVFQRCLTDAVADGSISPEETQRLERIARELGTTLGDLMTDLFRAEGESFLRTAFEHSLRDGRISDAKLQALVANAAALGLREDQLFAAIQPQAMRLTEHLLVDAKADGRLSPDEDRLLTWCLDRFRLPAEFGSYVARQIADLRAFSEIAEGRLPAITVPLDVELRSGEIPHYHGGAFLTRTRQLKSGPRQEIHNGTVIVTDSRLIFSSPSTAFSLGHRKVIGLREARIGLEVRASVKGAGFYDFRENARLAIAIYRTAIGRANQTIVAKLEDAPTRHIPRDVRQRVWQQYGGRCADCSATEYLEFDHIVPVARGGSNSEGNVQLLCRACNLKKSDHI